MGIPILMSALAVAGGCGGLALRLWVWNTAYDPAVQLFHYQSPAVAALLVLTAVLAVCFLLCALRLPPKGKTLARPVCPSPLYMMGTVMGALLLMGGGGLCMINAVEVIHRMMVEPAYVASMSLPVCLLACGGLCLPGGVGLLLTGKNIYRDLEADKASVAVVLPPIAMLVWLFFTHLEHATDPILFNYGFRLVAVILLLVGHYDLAGFYHGNAHPRRLCFCAWMGTSLALLSLADLPGWHQMGLLVGASVSLLAQSMAVIYSKNNYYK